ncbi:hypothetical protein EMMF5_000624 [Cystobasidiomycetes sp. EMM_F5]
MTVHTADILLVVIAILFPPAAAAILTGCSCALLLSILLTVLGYIPGHLYAFWLIYKKIQADERYGANGSVYVSQGVYQPIGAPLPQHRHQQQQAVIQPQQDTYHQQQQQHAPVDPPKGPPPAYGTM